MAERVDTVAQHTFTKERHPQAMSELLYHQPNQPSQSDHAPSYQLKAKAEQLSAEEQAGFRPARSTVEQIFNSHHREAPTAPAQSVPQLHRLADRFDRMWHAGLW